MARKKRATAIAGPMIDKDYMAQDDARTLAHASAIKSDLPRMKRAAMAASKMAEEQMDIAKGFKKISKMGKK